MRRPDESNGGRDRIGVIAADDDARMRQFYEEVLTRLGYRVLATVGDGEALVTACRNNEPELVISDILMPKLDGVAAARAILERMDIPFIFVSAYHDQGLIDRVSELSSFGYLVKPIKREDLETAIPVAISRFREAVP